MLADQARDELIRRAVVHVDLDVRVQLTELADHRRQQHFRQGRRARHRDAPPAQRRHVLEPGAQGVEVAQDALRDVDDVVGRGGGLQGARRAVEHAHPQLLFQLADQHADGRLRDVELGGRRAEAPQLVDRDERAQLLQGQAGHSGGIHEVILWMLEYSAIYE